MEEIQIEIKTRLVVRCPLCQGTGKIPYYFPLPTVCGACDGEGYLAVITEAQAMKEANNG